jgi:hypothetical protein
MNQPIIKGGLKFTPPMSSKGATGAINPSNAAKMQRGFQRLKDGDGDGIPDILEAFKAEVAKDLPASRPFSFMRGGCGMKNARGALIRRPVIPLRIRLNNLTVATTSGILAQIIAATGWSNGAVALSTTAGRVLLSRQTDPNQFYSQVQEAHIRYIKPVVEVSASSPGQTIDKDLSDSIRKLILTNFGAVLDRDGKGKELGLAPVYFSHLTNRGIVLDEEDQVFRFGDNSVLRFDYNGVGELGGAQAEYALSDITPQSGCTVSVVIGFDVIISEGPNDDVDAMIARAEGLA